MAKIAITTICYQNEEDVLAFAKELCGQDGRENLCLLVTCAKCREPEKLRAALADLPIESRVYDPQANLGYLNGCLFSLARYAEEAEYDWALISNTDIVFEQADFFAAFLRLPLAQDVWCVGTRVTEPSGKPQNPQMTDRPTLGRMRVRQLSVRSPFLYRLYRKAHDIKEALRREQEANTTSAAVYAVHGCSFFLKREAVEEIAKYAKNIFMYGEEVLISEICLKNGKKEWFEASLSLFHNESQVMRKIDFKRTCAWRKEGLDYLIKEFFEREKGV